MYDELVKDLREKAEFLACAEPLNIKNAFAESMKQAADAIEELNLVAESNRRNAKAWADTAEKAAEQIPRWIPVTERLPKGADARGGLCENVNLLFDDGLVTCGWMNGITERVYYLNVRDDYVQKSPISRVTHWMPLPEPPKEET